MEYKQITINRNKYEFINSSRNTRNGFAHDTQLIMNGITLVNTSCYYLNRTWECYRYQSVMLSAVDIEIDFRLNVFLREYKNNNNIKRLTQAKRNEAVELFEAQEEIKDLKELKEELKKHITY